MNCIIVTEKHCRNPFLTQNEVTGTWLIFKYLFLPTLCTSRRNMAKLWAFSCYLTCLTLFCHFVSHAHQEMTDFFTGIHRPRKTTTTKTGGRFTRSFQLCFLKDSLPYVQLFYFGKKKYEPAYDVKKLIYSNVWACQTSE